jgi:hypothetical protein
VFNITCDLGRLAVGEQATITIALAAPVIPRLSPTPVGRAAIRTTDRTPANNSASLT